MILTTFLGFWGPVAGPFSLIFGKLWIMDQISDRSNVYEVSRWAQVGKLKNNGARA